MEIKGTIIHALPEVSGVSKAGNAWKKKEYVLENTEGQFPRKVAFTCFGDNADKINLQVGQVATIYFVGTLTSVAGEPMSKHPVHRPAHL